MRSVYCLCMFTCVFVFLSICVYCARMCVLTRHACAHKACAYVSVTHTVTHKRCCLVAMADGFNVTVLQISFCISSPAQPPVVFVFFKSFSFPSSSFIFCFFCPYCELLFFFSFLGFLSLLFQIFIHIHFLPISSIFATQTLASLPEFPIFFIIMHPII